MYLIIIQFLYYRYTCTYFHYCMMLSLIVAINCCCKVQVSIEGHIISVLQSYYPVQGHYAIMHVKHCDTSLFSLVPNVYCIMSRKILRKKYCLFQNQKATRNVMFSQHTIPHHVVFHYIYTLKDTMISQSLVACLLVVQKTEATQKLIRI